MISCFYLLMRICIFFILIQGTFASFVQFSASPAWVKEGLTSSLKLQCCLNNSALTSSVVGRRDVSQPSVTHIRALTVMRNGQDVATATSTSAQILDSSSNTKVTGRLPATQDDTGCIELTIDHPTSSQTNGLVCKINGTDNTGQQSVLTKSLEITVTPPTTADLVGVIQQLQQDNARLQAEVGKSRHIETGTLDCTYKDENWAGRENGWKYDSQFASFTKVYENTPIVFISMLSNDHLQGDDVDYYVKVHSVNTNGFTMRCYSLNGPTRKVYNLNVQWIAFAS